MSVVFKLQGTDGKEYELKAGLNLYKSAAENKRSVRLEARYAAAEQGIPWNAQAGDVLDQMYASSGMFDSKFGGNSLTVMDLSKVELADGFRRGDGGGDARTVGARLLFPEFIMETMRADALREDGGDIISEWNKMVAVTTNVQGQRADQPIIDVSAPSEQNSGRIAQLAEPETLVSITTGEKSYRIPTNSIGLLISDEARSATTLDLVRIVMEAQARGERIRRINAMLKAMVDGDEDYGITALSAKKTKDYDSSLSSTGGMSKLAYLEWLRQEGLSTSINTVLTSLQNAISVDDSLMTVKMGDQSKIKAPFAGIDLALPTPKFHLFNPDVFGSTKLVGFDSRYAIQRFVNVDAAYEAIENYVMRRATAFRVDFGELASRLYDDAWSVLDTTA